MKKEKITVRDIAQVLKWAEVKRAHRFHYPSDKNNYEPVFNKIKTYEAKEHDDKREVLEIWQHGYRPRQWDKKKSKLEYLKECHEDAYKGISTNKFSMSFQPWERLANIPISEETLVHYSFEEIMAHFLWEITFFGQESDMQKKAKELFSSVEEYKTEKAEKLKTLKGK